MKELLKEWRNYLNEQQEVNSIRVIDSKQFKEESVKDYFKVIFPSVKSWFPADMFWDLDVLNSK